VFGAIPIAGNKNDSELIAAFTADLESLDGVKGAGS